ncbi:hypothetical protein GCM10020216_089230 [Nonomuraea helvata]
MLPWSWKELGVLLTMAMMATWRAKSNSLRPMRRTGEIIPEGSVSPLTLRAYLAPVQPIRPAHPPRTPAVGAPTPGARASLGGLVRGGCRGRGVRL